MIRKWDVYPVDQPLTLPPEAEVIHVGQQRGLPVVWTRDIPGALAEKRQPDTVQVFGTGMTPPFTADHIGSVQMDSGLVWHMFSVGPTHV